MPYTPEQRRQLHTKQSRLHITSGKPLIEELKEGIPVLRSTPEGVVEYVRYKGELYKKAFTRVSGEKKSISIDYAKLGHLHSVVWHDMILENSWVLYSASYFTPSYCKDVNGFVHLRGLVKNGSSQTADITSLPVGYRPSKIEILTGMTYGGDQCRVQIEVDGDIHGVSAAVGDGGMATNWVSLSGLIFSL